MGAAYAAPIRMCDVAMNLGLEIRELRRRRNWTQRELAEKVGCTESMLKKIEQGSRTPSSHLRVRLDEVLGELGVGEEADDHRLESARHAVRSDSSGDPPLQADSSAGSLRNENRFASIASSRILFGRDREIHRTADYLRIPGVTLVVGGPLSGTSSIARAAVVETGVWFDRVVSLDLRLRPNHVVELTQQLPEHDGVGHCLVFLDNASDTNIVEALIDECLRRGASVLVASNRPMFLGSGRTVVVEPFKRRDTHFTKNVRDIIGNATNLLDRLEFSDAELNELADATDNLPGAMFLIAPYLLTQTPKAVCKLLRKGPSAGLTRVWRTIGESIEGSLHGLGTKQRQGLADWCEHPEILPIDIRAAMASMSEVEASDLVQELVERQLLVAQPMKSLSAAGVGTEMQFSVGNLCAAWSSSQSDTSRSNEVRRRLLQGTAGRLEALSVHLTGDLQNEALNICEANAELFLRELRAQTIDPAFANQLSMLCSALQRLWIMRRGKAESVSVFESLVDQCDDVRAKASLTKTIGVIKVVHGDTKGAEVALQESLRMWRALGDAKGIGDVLVNLGGNALTQSSFENAKEYFSLAASSYRVCDDRRGEALSSGNLGIALTRLGELATAADALTTAVKTFDELGDLFAVASFLDDLAAVEIARKNLGSAAKVLRRALAESKRANDPRSRAVSLERVAEWVLLAEKDQKAAECACRLLGTATRIRTNAHLDVEATETGERAFVLASKLIGVRRARHDMEAGEQHSEQEVESVLAQAFTLGRGPAADLSIRELEVLRFAATGLTVAEMAGKMFIAHSTVKAALANAQQKLGASNRAAAVAQAAESGLL